MRYFCLLVAVCGFSCTTVAQEPEPDVAEKHTGDTAFFDAMGDPGGQDSPEVDSRIGDASSFNFWKHRAVTHGRKLAIRATAISVYISDCSWNYARSHSARVTSPSGTGRRAGSGWSFPNANQFGIVIRQGGSYWQINGTSSSRPTRISGLTNTDGVWVFVNDTNGNYGDNWGAFSVNIRVDAN